ncbi:MAG: mechanosensitive ion channel family protein, partial [Gemmatimonadota bacterium]
ATDVETRLTPAVAQVQEYWDAFVAQLPVLAVALLVVLLFWGASFMLGQWRRPAAWTGINPLLWSFISRLLRGIMVAVGLLLAFDILGITSLMGAVLGTAGIVGLAIGFAFKDIVENYLAGMLLSLRRPFSVNDLVLVGEFEGRIVRLTSRELVLLTLEGNHVRLPNAHVFKTPLTNFTINPRRLFRFDVGISVDEELQRALAVGVGTLEAMAGVMTDPPPFGRVMELGDSTVTVRFHGWVDQRFTDFLKVRSEAIRLVKAALDAEGIVMPEPTYRVLTRPLPERNVPAATLPGDVESEAARIDVKPDNELEKQVLDELEASDDENLLP